MTKQADFQWLISMYGYGNSLTSSSFAVYVMASLNPYSFPAFSF